MKHSLFAAALFALALSACGENATAVATSAAPAVAEPAPAPAASTAPTAVPVAEPVVAVDVTKPAEGAMPGTPDASLKVK